MSYSVRVVIKYLYRWFFACPDKLSYSKISSFLSCPLKYHFQYKKKWATRMTGPLIYGSVIHKVLELFHARYDVKLATEDDLFDLLEERWSSDGFKSPEEEQQYKERARRLLTKYLAEAKANPPDVWRTELFAEANIGGLSVVGQMDRIDREKDGSLTIIDYKTGDKMHEPESLQSDLQANLYYLLGEKTIGKKFKKFFFWYLEHDRKVPVTITDAGRKETEHVIRTVAHRMQFGEIKPKKGVLCNWCDFYERCPAWKDRPERLYKLVRESDDRMGLSYSKVSQYTNCPMVYKKVYLDKIPTKPKGFFAIGHTVHQTMEEFYMYDGPLAEPSLAWLMKLYDEHWIGRGYETKEAEVKARREGEQWMRNYFEKYVRGKFRKGTYKVEEYFELPLGRHAMIGYMDRLDKNDDGTYSLVDYKTDPVMRTQEEVNKDRQLYLYAWACKKMGVPLRDQTLIFVKFNEHITTTHTEKDIAEFEAEVLTVADEMVESERIARAAASLPAGASAQAQAEVDKRFPPKINKYCGGCDYLSVCPKREEILTLHRDKIMHAIDETKLSDRTPEADEIEAEPEPVEPSEMR